MFRGFFERWRKARDLRFELDFLISAAQPEASIADRLQWLNEIFHWIRAPGLVVDRNAEHKTGQIQATRLRYFLHLLSRHPEWKLKIAQTLRSIIRDTHAWELFSSTGLPLAAGLFSEAKERFIRQVVPQPPRDEDLGEIFEKVFSEPSDLEWLSRLDERTLSEIFDLFCFEDRPEENIWRGLSQDIEDAFLYLTAQIKSQALSPALRYRMGHKGPVRNLPFFQLTPALQSLIALKESGAPANELEGKLRDLREILGRCEKCVMDIRSHLNEFGVSVGIVFQIEKVTLQIERMRDLLLLYGEASSSHKEILQFILKLIREHQNQKSLRSLFSQNLNLLSKKIVERSAETGEHYITRDLRGYARMMRSALGGGLLTSITALLRIIIENLNVAYFAKGVLASVNYSGSFLTMQFANFTLATKQPAMTASHLASKMQSLEKESAQQNLLLEMTYILRSQVAAIGGNLVGVIPGAFLLFIICANVFHEEIFTIDEGFEILRAHSIWGPSMIYAGFTGILLWLSSLCAGWIDNWFAYRQIVPALASHRSLRFFLGEKRRLAIAQWLQKNIAAIAGSVSLGLFLGLAPKFAKFLGLPLDVRHVTLATGTLTFAVAELGPPIFKTRVFWEAVAGVWAIGFFNLFVSFAMAFLVAVNAQRVAAPTRAALYRNLWLNFSRNPIKFIFPWGLRTFTSIAQSENEKEKG